MYISIKNIKQATAAVSVTDAKYSQFEAADIYMTEQ